MYEWNEHFPQPPDPNEKVWRYMSFSKFVSLLCTQCLYFTRLDKFEDPFEGSSPKFWIDQREKIVDQIKNDPQYSGDEKKRTELIASYEHVPETLAAFRKFVAVNCWHLNSDESMAMWKLYSAKNEGVAIQTTYRGLVQSLEQVNERIRIGCVSYIDYQTDPISIYSNDALYMHKQKSFQHEREVRCLIYRYPANWRDEPVIQDGVLLPVNLAKLIENVYISPTSQEWYVNTVNEILARFGHKIEVKRSTLDGRPAY